MNVDLTLAAHTNVGKTTLMRTLLRRDIGEVADRPHVTDSAERHALLETAAGDVLFLWDTPGFGDSHRLLKRLRMSGNPLGWLQTQVWDRFVDRPFFCSQQAARAVRDGSDLVLYLVNAGEDLAASAYVEAELQILQWIGKPVLLLLNQTGAPRGAEAERADELRWQTRLSAYVPQGSALTLDAFARCWVQEDRLLGLCADLLPPDKREAFARLRAAWRGRNLAAFAESMTVLAAALAQTATDREPVQGAGLAAAITKVKRLASRDTQPALDATEQAALDSVARRLAERERAAADRLIAIHGLDGSARQRVLAASLSSVEVTRPVDVTTSGTLGGIVSGALGGLAADLAAGGVTLGAGTLIGAILGAVGFGGAAHAYNVATGIDDGNVRWTPGLLNERLVAMLVLYLAVAHYGRGRGAWVDEEAPAHWKSATVDALASRTGELDAIWAMAAEHGATSLENALEKELTAIVKDILLRLYPDSAAFLS